MIGRTFIEHEGVKRKVDKVWVVPYFDFQLHFDANNTWVNLQRVLDAVTGLSEYKILFEFSTTGDYGDVFSIEGNDGEYIIIGMEDGCFVVTDEYSTSPSIRMEATIPSNDGQYKLFELNVNSFGHEMYVNGEYLNHTYANGNSGVPLLLPDVVTYAALGKGVLTGFFYGLIKNFRITDQADRVLVQMKLNDKSDHVLESQSKLFGSVYNAFWEDGFNEDPAFREVINVYACDAAGQFENVHRG